MKKTLGSADVTILANNKKVGIGVVYRTYQSLVDGKIFGLKSVIIYHLSAMLTTTDKEIDIYGRSVSSLRKQLSEHYDLEFSSVTL